MLTMAAETTFFKCFQCGSTALSPASSHLIPTMGNVIPISQMKKQRPVQCNLLMTLPVIPHVRPQADQRQEELYTHVIEALLATDKVWGNLCPSADEQIDKHGVAMG